MDEMVARAIELSVDASQVDELGGLGSDVDHLVDEMEALRLAMDETDRMGDGSPPELPPPSAAPGTPSPA